MAKCTQCNRAAQADKAYCWYCDPEVPEIEKTAARTRGGRAHHKIPHNLNPDDYRPLTVENLKKLYEDLIYECLDAYQDDLAATIRNLVKVLPRAAEVAALEEMAIFADRLSQLETSRQGNLLPGNNGHIVEYHELED